MHIQIAELAFTFASNKREQSYKSLIKVKYGTRFGSNKMRWIVKTNSSVPAISHKFVSTIKQLMYLLEEDK